MLYEVGRFISSVGKSFFFLTAALTCWIQTMLMRKQQFVCFIWMSFLFVFLFFFTSISAHQCLLIYGLIIQEQF